MSDQAVLMVPWEPRDGWPTVRQVKAWVGEGRAWYCAGGPAIVAASHDGGSVTAAVPGGVVRSKDWPLGLRALVPFRDGHPVSWAEVDAAVEADLEKG